MADQQKHRINAWLLIACVTMGCLVHPSYAEEAQWIWGSERANENAIDGLCLFRKTFTLDALPESAVLQITCDDQYVLRINNRLVGVDENWQFVDQYDVTSILKQGENQIFVRARNMAKGPAGLMADLQLTSSGKSTHISSDSTWEASIQNAGTWNPDVLKIKSWKPAYCFGATASAKPWSSGITLRKEIRVIAASRRKTGPFQLQDGDRVLFLGNTVIEREQRYGYWESALTTRYADKDIVFRNLGWSGDTVFGEARARFGSQSDGFDHLEVHVHAARPSVIICNYGSNAIFAGKSGLDSFVSGYEKLLDALETTGASIVLMAPFNHEPYNGKLLTPDYNANREYYVRVIKLLAEGRGCHFMEMDTTSDVPLTDNGVHLTETGYGITASAFEVALNLPARAPVEVKLTGGNITGDGAIVSGAITPEEIKLKLTPAMLPATPSNRLGLTKSPHLKVTGLEQGNYEMLVDDHPAKDLTAEQLAAGIQLESLDQQASALVAAIRAKNELYFHRWRPQNETYLFLFRKHEQGNNAVEIPMFDPLVADIEKRIAELRKPKSISILLKRN